MTPQVTVVVMIPAMRTPSAMAGRAVRSRRSSTSATRAPVQAPVPGSGIAHEDDQADGAILFHDSALEVCPALQPVDFRSNPAGFAQPAKNAAEQKNEKGDWNEIAEDGGSRRCGWRQGRRLYRPELHRAVPAQAPWQ